MTTETSNARDVHTCSYACERPECIRAQRDELASRLTAAARGDVLLQTALRNLPQYISKIGLIGPDKHSAMQCFEVMRDALAAEGVQAGEVECDCPGKGKDDPALHAPNCPERMSQQPEARGVVDAEKLAHLIREWELHDKTFGHDGRHPLIADFRALLPPALTGERNG